MNNRAIVGETDATSAATTSHIRRDKATTKIGCPSHQMLRSTSAPDVPVPPTAPVPADNDNGPTDREPDLLEALDELGLDDDVVTRVARGALAFAPELRAREVDREVTHWLR